MLPLRLEVMLETGEKFAVIVMSSSIVTVSSADVDHKSPLHVTKVFPSLGTASMVS
jgi:hypothetical protein